MSNQELQKLNKSIEENKITLQHLRTEVIKKAIIHVNQLKLKIKEYEDKLGIKFEYIQLKRIKKERDIEYSINNAINFINKAKEFLRECENQILKNEEEKKKIETNLKYIDKKIENTNEYQQDARTNLKKELKSIKDSKKIQELYEKTEIMKKIIDTFIEIVSYTSQLRGDIQKLLSNKKIAEIYETSYKEIDKNWDDSYKEIFEKKINNTKEGYQNYLNDLYNFITTQKDKYQKFYDKLVEYNEEYLDKIGVYVKLRPETEVTDGNYKKYNKIIDIDEELKKLKISCPDKKPVEYGPFKDIFYCKTSEVTKSEVTKCTNEDAFNAIKSNFEWDKIKNKSTILFSYGISGSGKTYSMFGEGTNKGIYDYIIDMYKGYDTEQKYVFEHMIDSESIIINDSQKAITTFNYHKLKGDIRIIKGPRDIFPKINTEKSVNLVNVKDTKDPITIDQINKNREDLGNIKPTPNNRVSSRSHLFIVYEISKKGEKGYLVFVDSAGRESPLEIAQSYYTYSGNKNDWDPLQFYKSHIDPKDPERRKRLPNYHDEDINKNEDFFPKKIKANEYEEKVKHIKQVINEGIFINESLNHMVKYLDPNIKSKLIENDISKKPNKDARYYNLHEEEKNSIYVFEDPKDFKRDKKTGRITNDEILTYTIFDFLTSLAGSSKEGYKKFKFIMLACSRTDENKCNEIKTTFDFVDKIKST